MVEIHGTCEPGYEAVGEAFAAGFSERGETGAAVALMVEGELVVDLWGGHADLAAGRPWQEDTIAHCYSVTKAFAALCVVLLAARGALDLDAPVADVWPEYAVAGKHRTTVRQILTHQAGMIALDGPLPASAWADTAGLTEIVAGAPPAWEPGTAHGEQAALFGHLVGEVVRRVDGRTLGRFLAEEIAGPWELDFHVGLDDAEIARAATLHDPRGAWRDELLDDPRALLARSLTNPDGLLDPAVVNAEPYRRAEVAAVNGHGNARAIARLYQGLADGGALDGVRLLPPDAVDEMLRPHAVGRDLVLETDVGWGLGLHGLDDDGFFGMGGIGGYAGWGLRRPGVTAGFGYVTARLGAHDRAGACEDAVERIVLG